MTQEKIVGSAREFTLNTTYCNQRDTPIYIKIGQLVMFYSGLIIARQEIPTYTTFGSGLPKAKQAIRIFGLGGIGKDVPTMTYGVTTGGTLQIFDNGSIPSGTYFTVGGTYIAAE